jgi:ABC-type sulfate transport system permease component
MSNKLAKCWDVIIIIAKVVLIILILYIVLLLLAICLSLAADSIIWMWFSVTNDTMPDSVAYTLTSILAVFLLSNSIRN